MASKASSFRQLSQISLSTFAVLQPKTSTKRMQRLLDLTQAFRFCQKLAALLQFGCAFALKFLEKQELSRKFSKSLAKVWAKILPLVKNAASLEEESLKPSYGPVTGLPEASLTLGVAAVYSVKINIMH
eukprot:Plantae.Rhodophyta-Hildenbrandia_rubra.ctg39020.p1 GENE.Plantae.Rhodophyta-Hildenbrandia_rubra.ctg39020~~Plantae.Rhodophyta-Hildenbrandia_rubra.ctg39020.p1  ORF type:complete len:129 (+),score=11.65 Plantae.Rhodophyta-Hildenbrandia_rubra.ctg39020:118-504(+)